MKGPHVPEPDVAPTPRHRGRVAGRRANVVAGREEMACVQTHADAVGIAHGAEDRRQLLEAPADRVPATGRILEEHPDAEPARVRDDGVERGRDAPDPGVEADTA